MAGPHRRCSRGCPPRRRPHHSARHPCSACLPDRRGCRRHARCSPRAGGPTTGSRCPRLRRSAATRTGLAAASCARRRHTPAPSHPRAARPCNPARSRGQRQAAGGADRRQYCGRRQAAAGARRARARRWRAVRWRQCRRRAHRIGGYDSACEQRQTCSRDGNHAARHRVEIVTRQGRWGRSGLWGMLWCLCRFSGLRVAVQEVRQLFPGSPCLPCRTTLQALTALPRARGSDLPASSPHPPRPPCGQLRARTR